MELKRWGLSESSGSYEERDKANVNLCDMVIAFRLNKPKTGRGTTKTFNYARYGRYEDSVLPKYDTSPGATGVEELDGKKPVLVVWCNAPPNVHPRKDEFPERIKNFILKHRGTPSLLSGTYGSRPPPSLILPPLGNLHLSPVPLPL